MIYLIGGASRAGKSTLSKMIAEKYCIGFLSLDVLRSGLCHGAPQLGIDPRHASWQDARRMWPIVRAMIRSQLRDGRDYVIEGVCLRPIDVARIRKLYQSRIAACFLGYGDMDIATKYKHIKKHTDGPNDWLSRNSDAYIERHIRYNLSLSRKLQAECKTHRIAFYDTGSRFKSQLNAALRDLRQQRKAEIKGAA